jgi:hypothetical protein
MPTAFDHVLVMSLIETSLASGCGFKDHLKPIHWFETVFEQVK